MRSRKPTMQRTNNVRVYADYAKEDQIVRSVFNDKITADSFRRLLEAAAKRDSFEQPNYSLLMGTLTAKQNKEKLQALMDHYNCNIWCYNSFDNISNNICEMLAVSVLSGKMTAAKQLLKGYFNTNSFIYGYFSAPDPRCQPCNNPLYYIMLTKQYDLVALYYDLLKENRNFFIPNRPEEYAIQLDIDFTFISALLYDEHEFIKALLDCGYRPGSPDFAELAAYPAALNSFRTNFFSYYFPKRKSPPRFKDFISAIMTDDERYVFTVLVYKKFGKENADRFFDSIDFPKISSVNSTAIISERSNYNDSFDECYILGLIDDTLHIHVDMENIFDVFEENLRVFSGKEIIYIIDNDAPESNCLRGASNRILKLFLSQKLMFDFGDRCPKFLKLILSRNDKSVTALAVSQGMITQKNIAAVIDYLLEKHLLVALNSLYENLAVI